MVAVTESELYAAIKTKMMTAAETLDTSKYTVVGSPSFEAATAFPNSRSEKFLDLNGSSQYLNFDPTTDVPNIDQVIFSYWIKPDFNQAFGGHRGIFDGYAVIDSTHYGGIALNFNHSIDDFAIVTGAYPTVSPYYVYNTSGETWNADEVMHHAIFGSYNGSLDGGKSGCVFIDNTLVATHTLGSYAASTPLRNPTDIGRSIGAGYGYFDGGIFDFAALDYALLSASHTDAEIVQAIYSNTFGAGGTHKFIYELTGTTPVVFTPKIIII